MLIFWRNRKNRRIQRKYVLDVRLHARETRATRFRLFALSSAVAAGLATSFLVCWQGGQWLLERWFFQNPAFAVQELIVDTGDLLPPEWVRDWSQIHRGQNLMSLDLDLVKRNLDRQPLVAAVSLQRLPPDKLRIRVRPRFPVAEVRQHEFQPEGGLSLVTYFVDASGHVLRFTADQEVVLRPRLIRPGLPRLIGVPSQRLVPGLKLLLPNLETALGVAEAFGHSPMAGLAELSALDVSRPDFVVAHTAAGSLITFGLRDPARPLAWWRRVHDYAANRGQVIQSLNLSLTNNVPAVLQPSEAVQRPVSPRGRPANQRKDNA